MVKSLREGKGGACIFALLERYISSAYRGNDGGIVRFAIDFFTTPGYFSPSQFWFLMVLFAFTALNLPLFVWAVQCQSMVAEKGNQTEYSIARSSSWWSGWWPIVQDALSSWAGSDGGATRHRHARVKSGHPLFDLAD